MSHGGGLFALGEGVASEPGFDNAIPGYRKRQVDRYVAQAEAEMAALAAERDEAYSQIQKLATQVQQLQDEVFDLRRHTAVDASVSFRHLGPRVEQILGLAEDQAAAIRDAATREAAELRADAERVLTLSRERAQQAIRDFEITLAARRQEEEQADAKRRAVLMAELQAAEAYATKQRSDADTVLRATQEEARRIGAAAAAYAEQSRAHGDAQLAALQVQVDRERAERRNQIEVECQGLRAAADQYAVQVRAQADAYAGAVVADAEQDAAALRRPVENAVGDAQTAAADNQVAQLHAAALAEESARRGNGTALADGKGGAGATTSDHPTSAVAGTPRG